ncbi:MAG: hypothetical protein KME55_24175 [Nostoc indistinguendum CM1-VF10]|nr:hypothetical protein [Nostoc indistinguendum CM1-VF10]
MSTSDPPCRIIALFNQAGGVLAPTYSVAVHRLQITFASTPAALDSPLQQSC